MKKKPNPLPTINDICVICGEPYAELHEVFYGNPNSALSQKWGMQVRLCGEHHRGHKEGVHHNIEFDLALKVRYQKRFETEYGHDKFMKVFGRNYL